MFEDAIERSGFTWQFIHDYQPFMVGLLALGAAVLTALYLRKQIKASVEEGKRERAFRMKQHEIEIQTKRRAVAVMLTADMRSGVETTGLELLAEITEKDAERFVHLNKNESSTLAFFSPVYKLFLNNYSHHLENMPLMRVETVEAVSRFYFCATRLFEEIETLNATVEGGANDKTTASFIDCVLDAAKDAKIDLEQALPLLVQEAGDAQEELNRLKKA